ncbi:MAG: zinc metallopeptidase, partial [Hyphomicrobiaceae bacterium]
MRLALIVILLVVAVAYIPGWWVKRVIRKHGQDRSNFPGTGAEFARHILDEMKLTNVFVDETDRGDHYDPR